MNHVRVHPSNSGQRKPAKHWKLVQEEVNRVGQDDFSAHADEVLRRMRDMRRRPDEDNITIRMRYRYWLENFVASDSNAMFKLLCIITLFFMIVLGFIWTIVTNLGMDVSDDDGRRMLARNRNKGHQGSASANSRVDDVWFPHFLSDENHILFQLDIKIWETFQMLATGGFDDSLAASMKNNYYASAERLLITVMLIFGLVVFAVLVGIITEAVTALMGDIEEGKTMVAEQGHTLILGWNESTMRVVVQCAFVRRQWMQLNEASFARRWFPWMRIKPSTPVANNRIVIMANQADLTKSAMNEMIERVLSERGVLPKYCRVGWDVICRVGDPMDLHDLARVNARAATSVLVMMTEEDRLESEECGGHLSNGATIRTLLALRSILCAASASVLTEGRPPPPPPAAGGAAGGGRKGRNWWSAAKSGSAKEQKQRAGFFASSPGPAAVGGGGEDGGGAMNSADLFSSPGAASSSGPLASNSGSGGGGDGLGMSSFDSREVRLVIQLQTDSPFLDAACFRSPAGRLLVETLEVTRFVNSLLFHCASRPGLSSVFLDAMNLELAAFRSRPVSELKAGPLAQQGWLAGKMFREASAGSCWSTAVLVGITSRKVLYRSDKGRLTGSKGEIVGLVPEPSYIIRHDDLAIFMCKTSVPECSRDPRDLPEYHRRVLQHIKSAETLHEAKKIKKSKERLSGEGKGVGSVLDPRSASAASAGAQYRRSSGSSRGNSSAGSFGSGRGGGGGGGGRPTIGPSLGNGRFEAGVGSTIGLGKRHTAEAEPAIRTPYTPKKHLLLPPLNAEAERFSGLTDDALHRRQKILVCGWRRFWTNDPRRLESRVSDVARSAAPGSFIGFINMITNENEVDAGASAVGDRQDGGFESRVATFADPLKEEDDPHPWPQGFTKAWSLRKFPGIRMFHCRGNATNAEDLGPLLSEPGNIAETIVLGTQEYTELSPRAKDTRVLSVLLLLKHLTQHWTRHKLHAIAENQLDQTACVAVVPGGNLFNPDFVNTQAFTARALVMALAYPNVQPAIKEMFDDWSGVDGTPEFNLVPVPLLGFVGRVIAFGVVQRIVTAKFQGWGIAIGLMARDGTLELAPGIGACRHWLESDRIVVLRRRGVDLQALTEARKAHETVSYWQSGMSGRGNSAERSVARGEDEEEDAVGGAKAFDEEGDETAGEEDEEGEEEEEEEAIPADSAPMLETAAGACGGGSGREQHPQADHAPRSTPQPYHHHGRQQEEEEEEEKNEKGEGHQARQLEFGSTTQAAPTPTAAASSSATEPPEVTTPEDHKAPTDLNEGSSSKTADATEPRAAPPLPIGFTHDLRLPPLKLK